MILQFKNLMILQIYCYYKIYKSIILIIFEIKNFNIIGNQEFQYHYKLKNSMILQINLFLIKFKFIIINTILSYEF